MNDLRSKPVGLELERCKSCLKLTIHCICDTLTKLDSELKVLILQHPQEVREELNSAPLVAQLMPQCVIRQGLSWRNLAHAWGSETDPKKWLVFYLGKRGAVPSDGAPITVLNRKGTPHPDSSKILEGIEGVILLDGTWAQAKTMWWRNAWLLKVHRAVISPTAKSRYGKPRRAAREEGVATIEAIAVSVAAIEKNEEDSAALFDAFSRFLDTFRKSPKLAKDEAL